MLKTFANMALGAIIFASVTAALAVQGVAPVIGGGAALIDQNWLNGLAGGLNYSYQSGITAVGTTQATATALPSGIMLLEVDTAAGSTGVALPLCYAGTQFVLNNNGANNITVYPAVANNPTLSPAAQDTINNTTTLTLNAHTQTAFACAKNGVWYSS